MHALRRGRGLLVARTTGCLTLEPQVDPGIRDLQARELEPFERGGQSGTNPVQRTVLVGLPGLAPADEDGTASRGKAAEETREALSAYRRVLEEELAQAERWLEGAREKAEEEWAP